MFAKWFVLIFVTLVVNNAIANEKYVVCYYGTWATYRHGLGKFDVDHVNTDLCTHLIYTFVGIDSQGNVVTLDPYLDLPDNWGRDNFGKFNALKQKNSNLKTILAVGGWNEGSGKYSVMAANPTLRTNFISSALKMVLEHGFDGFDLDWEYPNRRDTVFGQADVDNFTQLLKEMREEFDKYGLLLTAAVSSVEEMASLSYDVSAISKYLDIINLMTYDMYGAWDPVTGHNAPLHKGEGDESVPRNQLYTADVAMEYWLDQGCPPEKLVLGLPLYGRTFTLTDANVNGVRASASGAGIAGPFTVTNGFMGYNEICDILQTQTWDIRYDALAKVPYAVQGRNWVSFDNPDSLKAKVEYGLKFNIAGAMVWSIETDDFHGLCHGEDFPLLRAVNRALGRLEDPTEVTGSTLSPSTTVASSSSSSSSTTSSTSAVTTTTTPAPQIPEETDSVCKSEGFAANPEDCGSFYMCIRATSGILVPSYFECPGNLYWDQETLVCNYPELVKCGV